MTISFKYGRSGYGECKVNEKSTLTPNGTLPFGAGSVSHIPAPLLISYFFDVAVASPWKVSHYFVLFDR